MKTESKQLSIREVRDIVEIEGLEYAVYGYLNADRIHDERLRELWKEAGEKLIEIERMLFPDA